MNVKLGQSEFQDTYFVAGAQLTPYRQLRQLELEIDSIQASLKSAEFELRRQKLKLSKLDESDEEQKIDADEIRWNLSRQVKLVDDAVSRLKNFERMKENLILSVPQEYWDAGFEAAEEEHWVLHFTRMLTMSQIAGLPDKNALEQVLLLPDSAQERIMLGVHQMSNQLALKNERVLQLAQEIKP